MTDIPEISQPRILALDAMGVIYQSEDDVAELLVPFIRERGGDGDEARIERAYIGASLGEISARQFWETVGLSTSVEDDYLGRHRLNPGVDEAIKSAREHFEHICCLSNDVSEWSLKLRQHFGLHEKIDSWHISGDLRVRKPQPTIYQKLFSALGVHAEQILFIDDRVKNLEAARLQGCRTVLFGGDSAPGFQHMPSFNDVRWDQLTA